MTPQPFPWGRAMAFGLGALRLPPRDFWSMTPRELACAAEGLYGRAAIAPSRDALAELMRAFPDGDQT
ncbi:rcc01693 family protein [Methylosinus sp. LW4]|uniref:rcc01693 family protein n=1 Tax=Methylosinus sp. LW4 TaxID=136993 RepID=UPI0003AB4639|nr:rcc01693 family protein [Methylosinus sp. LW4]